MKKVSVSLEEYSVRKPGPRVRCDVCKLPQLDEINRGIRSGKTRSTVLSWLNDVLGLKVTRYMVDQHFKKCMGVTE